MVLSAVVALLTVALAQPPLAQGQERISKESAPAKTAAAKPVENKVEKSPSKTDQKKDSTAADKEGGKAGEKNEDAAAYKRARREQPDTKGPQK
jgi:hypothetical protein